MTYIKLHNPEDPYARLGEKAGDVTLYNIDKTKGAYIKLLSDTKFEPDNWAYDRFYIHFDLKIYKEGNAVFEITNNKMDISVEKPYTGNPYVVVMRGNKQNRGWINFWSMIDGMLSAGKGIFHGLSWDGDVDENINPFPPDILPPKPPKPVCPECGGNHDADGDCTNPDCGENPNPPTVNPPPISDQLPQVWGHTTNDMQDVKGHAGYSIPVSFRAWDDIGLIKFYYCEIKEPDSPNIEILRPFTPTKLAGFGYRFNLFKELEGTYQYKIVVYDTSMQRGESNTFNVIVEPPITPPSPPPTPPSVSDSEYIILYDKNASDFTNNGIGILDNDTIDYTVDKEENSTYELTLKYLANGRYIDELLDDENIIKCKSDMSDTVAQLFRIYDTQYDMKENTIIVKAQHISYDLNEVLVESVNLVDVTCKQATQTLMSKAIGNDRFVVESNISKRANFKQERINALEGIVGVENSIFDVYGSSKLSIDRNNFNYTINTETTNDNGVLIAYRKNMLGFKRTSNTRGVIAGIYPYAHVRNGSILRLKEKVVYSPNKARYGTSKIKPIDCTSDTVIDENSLREAAKKYFSDGCDLPKLNYEVDFIQLYKSNPSKAAELQVLEDISLGDTVTVQDEKIGLSVKAKVIRTVYNRKKSRYTKIELGNFKNEYRMSKKNEQNNLKRTIRSVIE